MQKSSKKVGVMAVEVPKDSSNASLPDDDQFEGLLDDPLGEGDTFEELDFDR